MQSMKKIMSLLLSLMLVAALACAPVSAWETRTEEADLRLGFLNDTHITKSGAGEALAKQAMSTLKELGMEKLAFVGDVVYYNSANDDPLTDRGGYTKLWNAVSEAGWDKSDVIAYAMGNHEFPQANTDATVSANSIQVFEEEYGKEKNHHVVQNGFHIIAGAPINYNNVCGEETENYLMTEIDKAIAEDATNDVDGAFPEGVIPDSEKPVILLLHQPMAGTLANQTGSQYSQEFIDFLGNRPQVVNITAHKHLLAQHPETIGQDAGFTAFQTPMTAGGYQSQWGCVEEGNITDQMCSQGSFLEIADNVVYLYRVDYKNGAYIGQPFVVDIPNIVADRIDDNEENDFDNMPYTVAKRSTITTTAEFPMEAELTTIVKNNNIIVTHPNNAYIVNPDSVQQDDFVRGYKVEAVGKDGTVFQSAKYQADFWKAPENRAESYTRSIGSLAYNTEYTVNVYPMTPFGAFGEPISATVTTEEQITDSNSIRYEFEEYCPTGKLVATSPYVSENMFVISAQTSPYSVLNRGDVLDEEGNQQNPYTFSFPVELPVNDTYKVETTMNHHGAAGNFVSDIIIKIDGEEIFTNDKSYVEDLSMNGTFPWNNNIPMARYMLSGKQLTAGEHTVTVEIYHPTNTTQVQPFLFCMDYIQFTPGKLILKSAATDRAEIEDYIQNFPYTLNDGTVYIPKIEKGELSSGGSYAQIDSVDGKADNPYEFRIPLTVQDAGTYEMEMVSITSCSKMDIYLDDTNSTPISNGAVTETIDTQNTDGKYPVFSSGWAQASKFTKIVNLPEGDHELIFVIQIRPAEKDLAKYIDYIQFRSLVQEIYGGKTTVIEAEDIADTFYMDEEGNEPKAPEVRVSPNASGESYICFDTVHEEDHPAVRSDLSVVVGRTATYNVEYIASNVGSKLNIYVDGVLVNENVTSLHLDQEVNAEGKYDYFDIAHHAAIQYNFSVDLTAGKHTISLEFTPRPEQGVLDVAGCLDYVKFTPADLKNVVADAETRIEFEDLTTLDVESLPYASGGKMVYHNWGNTKPALSAALNVEESGYYDISYVMGCRSLTGAGEANVNQLYLSSITVSLGEKTLGNNDETPAKFLPEYTKWTTAPMALYENKSVWLEAGEYLLSAQVTDTKDAKYKYQLDYISFVPSDMEQTAPVEGFKVENGILTAYAIYDAPVLGYAVMALYENGKFVGMTSYDVASATDTLRFVTPVSGNPTEVKVFIWDSLANGKPKTAEKILSTAE